MMSHKISYTTLAAAALLLLLTGCHKSISWDLSEGDPTCVGGAEQPVRITAEIAGYSPAFGAPTRALVDPANHEAEWIADPTDDQKKDIKVETEEYAVYCVVLAAYKYDESTREYATKPTKLAFYYSPALMYAYRISQGGESYKDGEAADDEKITLKRQLDELKKLNLLADRKDVRAFSSGALAKELTMDLELEPGKYNFLLIANSWTATNQALEAMDSNDLSIFDPTMMEGPPDRTKPFTSLELIPDFFLHIPTRMMPMVGQRELTVTEAGGELMPEITLERAYARLDITLTTSKRVGKYLQYFTTDGEGGSYSPQDYLLTDLSFYNLGPYNYMILPQKDEHSRIDGRILSPSKTMTVEAGSKDKEFLFNYDDFLADKYILDKEKPMEERHLLAKTQFDHSLFFIHKLEHLGTRNVRPLPDKPLGLDTLYMHRVINHCPIDISRPTRLFHDVYSLWARQSWEAGMWTDGFEPKTSNSNMQYKSAAHYLDFMAVHIYLPPLYQPGTEGDREMAFSLTFRKKDGSDERTYRIRLSNQKGAPDGLYSIRRNTIYRYDLNFYGNSLRYNDLDYDVPTWTHKDVDLPW